MNFQQLEYIVALDEQRHFAKAADVCNITQPTLSTMIQRLEDELGVKLFDRKANPIQTSDIGKQIIQQAKRILHEANQIPEIIKNSKNELQGAISIGVLPTIAPYLLPSVLPIWQKKLPKVSFNIKELKTSQCIAALQNDEISMAIIASEAQTEGLCDELLYYEAFYGYVSRNEPVFNSSFIRSAEIDGSSLWLLDEGHCFRDQLVRFCRLKTYNNKKNTYQQGSLETFMRLVERGQGVTFIPALVIDMLSTEQKELVRPFSLPIPVRQIRLAYRNDFIRTAICKQIVESVKLSVPREMLTLSEEQCLA